MGVFGLLMEFRASFSVETPDSQQYTSEDEDFCDRAGPGTCMKIVGEPERVGENINDPYGFWSGHP